MAERKIRHIEDVFGQPSKENQSNDFPHGKNGYVNMFKKKKAPAPPGQLNMPKIGNYQPKILMEPTSPKRDSSAGPDWNKPHPDVNERRHSNTGPGKGPSSPVRNEKFIIGDKNIPITIENNADDITDDAPRPPPRRKRSAPAPVPLQSNGVMMSNPMFGRSVSQRSDEERFGMNFEEQGGDIDFGSGIDNPGFDRRRRESSSSWRNSDYIESSVPSRKETNEPFIPPPDYDDEEVTMNFEDEFGSFDCNRNVGLYKQIEGDDFGRYLRDDEDFILERKAPWNGPTNFKSKAPMPKQKVPKGKDKNKKKNKKESDLKRNTIRDFTFSDSRIGWGDRTVKSTSAKGRYLKREKEKDRQRVDKHFQQNGGPGSYEDFLRKKNGPPDDISPSSSDSGVELGDPHRNHRHSDKRMNGHVDKFTDRRADKHPDKHVDRHSDVFLHSQPKQMRSSRHEHKPSVWQKLTWRFRKSVTVTKL